MATSSATIRVRLTPRSSRNEVQRYDGGTLFVRVTAPPVDGAANAALIALLATWLDVPKTSIRIGSGASSREKQVIVEGKDPAGVEAILARFAAAGSPEEEA
jgi:hypothetical protein